MSQNLTGKTSIIVNSGFNPDYPPFYIHSSTKLLCFTIYI